MSKLVALGDVTVHTYIVDDSDPENPVVLKDGDRKSVNLWPGLSVDAAIVPDQVLEDAKAGKIERLKFFESDAKADKFTEQIAAGASLELLGVQFEMNATEEPFPSGDIGPIAMTTDIDSSGITPHNQ